jgi:hypothetical protein
MQAAMPPGVKGGGKNVHSDEQGPSESTCIERGTQSLAAAIAELRALENRENQCKNPQGSGRSATHDAHVAGCHKPSRNSQRNQDESSDSDSDGLVERIGMLERMPLSKIMKSAGAERERHHRFFPHESVLFLVVLCICKKIQCVHMLCGLHVTYVCMYVFMFACAYPTYSLVI